MSSIHIGPIKDFALGIYDGPHATPKESTDGPVFLGIKNVTPQGALDLSQIRHVSEEDYPKWTKRVVPQENDIVFSYEATLHRYALIPEGFRGCLGRRMALVRPDQNKVDPRFLHYYFQTRSWRTVVESNIISGATVDRIPLTRFPDFEVRLPDLGVQERIASVLSAYDGLIEINRRRIRLLEDSVRLLYKEWFVHLRFPGHEHLTIIDGVPEGWVREPFTNVADFKEGPGLRNHQYRDEGIPFLNIRTFNDDEIDLSKTRCIDETEVASKYQHFLLEEDDHVVSSSGTLGRLVTIRRVHLPVMLNTSLIRMRPIGRMKKWFLKAYLKNGDFLDQARSMATGTAQLNYGPSHLKLMSVLMPSTLIIDLFEDHVGASYQQIKVLLDTNLQLTEARNLILPRLMNGEIVV